MTYKYIIILALLLLVPSLSALAQEEGREGTTFLMMGIGSSNQLDTYLSPMEYKGTQVSFLTGRERMTGEEGRTSFQSMLQGAFTSTKNPARTGTEWGGRLAYDAGWHHNWRLFRGFSLKAGAQVGADLGFLYNNRNSNNPAQGRLSLDVAASAGASYAFHIGKLPLLARYQADLPVMGVMFSPQFGQSYYELSQGNRDHNVCFMQPGNALSLRQLLTVDLVFRRTTLRMGYLFDARQSHVNNIKVHDYSHSFMLGYVRYFRVLKREERKERGL